jgi:hypothetical protein
VSWLITARSLYAGGAVLDVRASRCGLSSARAAARVFGQVKSVRMRQPSSSRAEMRAGIELVVGRRETIFFVAVGAGGDGERSSMALLLEGELERLSKYASLRACD